MMHKNMNIRSSKLWLWFTLIVFSIMIVSTFIIGATAYIVISNRYHISDDLIQFWPMIFTLSLSVVIGTVIAGFVGHKILYPISKFVKASGEVANGNFSVRLPETSKIEAVRDMSVSFNKMAESLSCIETLRNDFVVNVSHEFKTPISAIEGYAMLLQNENLSSEEYSEYTKMIIDGTKQLSTLTGNILKLSKLENGDVVLEKSRFRLDEQVRQAILIQEQEWTKKNIDLHLSLQNIIYYGDEDLLMHVWVNLIANAIKFTGESGRIDINVTARPSKVYVVVSDNGVGMSREVIDHIFEKFYQGDNARQTNGNGLGLPLIKRIVELCGGEINVMSEEGNGSRFIVALPVP